MTTEPAIYGQFGTTLAFAERTLTDQLREHLAQRDTEPETWYALQLIATRGPGLSREARVHDLERSPNLNTDSTGELLARLEADGPDPRGRRGGPDGRGGQLCIGVCASTSLARPSGC